MKTFIMKQLKYRRLTLDYGKSRYGFGAWLLVIGLIATVLLAHPIDSTVSIIVLYLALRVYWKDMFSWSFRHVLYRILNHLSLAFNCVVNTLKYIASRDKELFLSYYDDMISNQEKVLRDKKLKNDREKDMANDIY